MIFPSVKERETDREKGLGKSATVASKSALYLVLICLFDYLFMHLFVFALCFRQHLEWRTEEKGADSRARGNKIRYYGMYVYMCVCVWTWTWTNCGRICERMKREWQQLFQPTQLTGPLLMRSSRRAPVPLLHLSECQIKTHTEY